MEFDIWHIWVLIGIVMILIELFTPIFIFASIGIGCFIAAIASAFGADFVMQLIILSLSTGVSFLFVRPMLKQLSKNRKDIKTNADGMLGKVGIVTEDIDNPMDAGQVKIDGVLWKAQSIHNNSISKGNKIIVKALDSIILYVEEFVIDTKAPLTNPLSNSKSLEQLKIRIGNRVQLIELSEVNCIYTENKNSFAQVGNGKSYLLDDSLDKLEKLLPREKFFRANRQYIIQKSIVNNYKSIENGKIELEFQWKESENNSIVISRLKAAAFRKWMEVKAEM